MGTGSGQETQEEATAGQGESCWPIEQSEPAGADQEQQGAGSGCRILPTSQKMRLRTQKVTRIGGWNKEGGGTILGNIRGGPGKRKGLDEGWTGGACS